MARYSSIWYVAFDGKAAPFVKVIIFSQLSVRTVSIIRLIHRKYVFGPSLLVAQLQPGSTRQALIGNHISRELNLKVASATKPIKDVIKIWIGFLFFFQNDRFCFHICPIFMSNHRSLTHHDLWQSMRNEERWEAHVYTLTRYWTQSLGSRNCSRVHVALVCTYTQIDDLKAF